MVGERGVPSVTVLPKRSPEPDCEAGIDALGWDEIGLIAEGLALGLMPIEQATDPIIAQYDLGPRGAMIMGLISSGKRFPTELSEALRTGRSLITSDLARLTEAGLITATRSRDDRRRTELGLTGKGKAAWQRARGEMERILRINLAHYSAREIRLFIRMLCDARRLVSAGPALPAAN